MALDILIAATALIAGLGVVTNNVGHFSRIMGSQWRVGKRNQKGASLDCNTSEVSVIAWHS